MKQTKMFPKYATTFPFLVTGLALCAAACSSVGPAENKQQPPRGSMTMAPPPAMTPPAAKTRDQPHAMARTALPPRAAPPRPAPRRASTSGTLAAWERQAFAVPERDNLKPIKGLRYLRSNETELHLFGPYVNGLGGGYVGVGADQNYTLAAMAKSSFVWLMDYDPFVARLHLIYRALILEKDDPRAFVAIWPQTKKVLAILQKTYAGDKRLPYLTWLYKRYKNFLRPYLGWSLKRKRQGQGTTWLSSPVLYKRVRTLWQEGRFQAIPGDLHGTRVFRGIGAAARRLGVPLRIVYLSNAEMYLPYSASFQTNMKAVFQDAKTLLVRTVRGKYKMMGDRWHYNIQPFKDYLRRLATGKYRKIHRMMSDFQRAPLRVRKALMQPRGFSRFTKEVPNLVEFKEKMRQRRPRRRRR